MAQPELHKLLDVYALERLLRPEVCATCHKARRFVLGKSEFFRLAVAVEHPCTTWLPQVCKSARRVTSACTHHCQCLLCAPQYSGSVSPFHAKTIEAPILAMSAATWS